MAGETIISVTYGLPIKPTNDPYIEIAEKAVHQLALAVVPGKYLVDTLPWLKYIPEWVPGAGFQTDARMSRVLANEMAFRPYEAAKREIVSVNRM